MIAAIGNTSLVQPRQVATKKSTCSDSVKQCFSNLNSQFQQSCAGKIYQKISPYNNLIYHGAYSIYYGFNIYSPNTFATNAPVRTDLIGKLVNASKCIKVTALAAIPLAIYNIYDNASQAIRSADRCDFILKMITQMGWLNDCIACSVTGLKAAGAVAMNVLPAVNSLYGIGAIFALAGVALSSKRIHESRVLDQNMVKLLDKFGPEKPIQYLLSKDDVYLQRHFKVEGKDLRTMINRIKDKALASVEQKKNICKQAFDILRDRIRAVNWSHALVIAATVITFIGMIFLLCTPLVVVAYGLLLAGSLVHVAKFIQHKISTERFLTQLGS